MKKTLGVIYKITNIVNNKVYIGKLSRKSDFTNYWGSGLLIKRSIKKYGINNFKKEILEIVNIANQNINEKEKFWINTLNSNNLEIGYNISKGGDGGDNFSNKPEELKNITRIRISKAHKGIKQNLDWVKKRTTKTTGKGNGMYGKTHTVEAISKIRKALKGRKLSDSVKSLMRERMLGSKNSVHKVLKDPLKYKKFIENMSKATTGSKNARAINVSQFNLNGQFLKIFGTLKEVSVYFKGYKDSIFIKKLKQAVDTKTPFLNYLWKYNNTKIIEKLVDGAM